ncbi:unnamed protein product [Trypanosoma congolense IL3000]|uniref:WGS project CAEQ00000000 data, annotated contig 589 n=1 Tax=Trypanosoma congolense (strain IL3000) TaxID=1068625 RepID=F9WH38_TRYCI|nr:unnamed protein product [Trypanosoma congolense IL3000]
MGIKRNKLREGGEQEGLGQLCRVGDVDALSGATSHSATAFRFLDSCTSWCRCSAIIIALPLFFLFRRYLNSLGWWSRVYFSSISGFFVPSPRTPFGFQLLFILCWLIVLYFRRRSFHHISHMAYLFHLLFHSTWRFRGNVVEVRHLVPLPTCPLPYLFIFIPFQCLF